MPDLREVLEYVDALLGFAMTLTRNKSDAEDLVQETYTSAIGHFAGLRADSNIKGWLFTIMRNQWLKQLRRVHGGPRFIALDDADAVPMTVDSVEACRAQDPQVLYIRRWEREEIRRGLLELSHEYRVAIVLRDIEGFSYREMAEILDCPQGTVMSRLSRGRARLKQVLEAGNSPKGNQLQAG